MADDATRANERREHPRYSAELEAFIGRPTSKQTPVVVRNLGLGGMLLEPSEPLQYGSTLIMSVKLPESEIRCTALVVWARPGSPNQAGIRFVEMDRGAETELVRYVEERARSSAA